MIHGIVCYATRISKKKRKWVGWTGQAFFDWHKGRIQIPANTPITSTAVETDIELWDDYDSDVPTTVKGSEILIRFDESQHLPDNSPIPDLMSANPIYTMFAGI